jgi:hypothetical protein
MHKKGEVQTEVSDSDAAELPGSATPMAASDAD